MSTFYKGNNSYNASLTTDYTVGDATLGVNTIPTNVPTIVTVARGTDKETRFTVTGAGSGLLTGVSRLDGANTNISAGVSVECMEDAEFINQLQSAVFDQTNLKGLVYAADGGSTDTYAITLPVAPSAYNDIIGLPIAFKANTVNTGPATLNVNSLGAKTIKKNHDQTLADGDIESGQIVTVVYDGTNFQLQSNTETAVPAISTDGWVQYSAVTPISGTLDDPSFQIVFAGVDLSTALYPGMRVKLTQSTTKYFIITKVSFSTDTTVTLYGGTDYDLVATGTTAISAFYYSTAKAPAGFPLSPLKWSEETNNTSNQTQATPTANTVYNVGSLSLSVPIGAWRLLYMAAMNVVGATASNETGKFYAGLSSANNSFSDADFESAGYITGEGNGTWQLTYNAYREKFVNLTAKTPYYLNISTSATGVASLNIRGAETPTIIRAVCAYL